jgi:alpha-tubulin suppressor-like RCC1 family protein
MGTVYCWGNNGSGQLGDGTRTSAGTPVVATELQGALQLAAGIRHTCARFADGTIGCVGGNDAGQLGGQTTVPTASPRQSLLTCPVP